MQVNNEEKKVVEIKICMGSSCYARGNGINLEIIEEYVKENGLDDHIVLSGSRCEGMCSDGPNITIDGKLFAHIDRETLIDVLKETLPNKGGNCE